MTSSCSLCQYNKLKRTNKKGMKRVNIFIGIHLSLMHGIVIRRPGEKATLSLLYNYYTNTTYIQVYIAETSPKELRGIFGSLNEILIILGITFSYGVGSIENFPYYYVALVAVGIVALFEVLVFWLPETPRSLLSRGYGEEAENVLRWLRGSKYNIKTELDEIKETIAIRKKKGEPVWRQFSKKSILVPFIYMLVVAFCNQAGGISFAVSYAATVYSEAGISNPRMTAIYTVGVVMLIGNFVSLFTVDLLGRKVLLILSGTGMFIGMNMLGTHFYITRPSLCDTFNSTVIDPVEHVAEPCNTHFGPLAILSIVLFQFAFAIGWGPIPWLLLSELLPLSVRGVASGFAMFVISSTAAVVSGFYLEYTKLFRPWFTMWTFSLINLAAALFVLIFIPETKGKSLEEMERRFEKMSNPLHCSCLSKATIESRKS